jgi:hypothetical protein
MLGLKSRENSCYFGEHLLSEETHKPVAIVESEKTAVIASIYFPDFVWLACGGKQNLKVEYLKKLGQRRIILFPDSDGFAKWEEVVRTAQIHNLNVAVSTLLEDSLTEEQKKGGYDLADFLIAEQREINDYNVYADRYNAAVDSVVNDTGLLAEFNVILDEKKSILMIDGGYSEKEAEAIISDFETLRQVVWSVASAQPEINNFRIPHEGLATPWMQKYEH